MWRAGGADLFVYFAVFFCLSGTRRARTRQIGTTKGASDNPMLSLVPADSSQKGHRLEQTAGNYSDTDLCSQCGCLAGTGGTRPPARSRHSSLRNSIFTKFNLYEIQRVYCNHTDTPASTQETSSSSRRPPTATRASSMCDSLFSVLQ